LLSGPDFAADMSQQHFFCHSWHPPGHAPREDRRPPLFANALSPTHALGSRHVILQLLIIIIPPESLPNSEFVTFFWVLALFFTFQEQSRNCRDGDFDGQCHRSSRVLLKCLDGKTPCGSAKLFSQSLNTAA